MKGILGDIDVEKKHGCDVVGLESLAFKKKVYVCGLPDKTNVFDLIQFFNKYAPVKHCKLGYKLRTGQFLNFGFVEFKDEGAAERIRTIRYFEFKGKKACIEVKEAFPTKAAENKNISIAIHEEGRDESYLRRKKVFVDGIPGDARANDIIKYFNIYAPVICSQEALFLCVYIFFQEATRFLRCQWLLCRLKKALPSKRNTIDNR
ncbi:hypothetical protein ACTXT7_006952 [Hymenolepis weldensis]